MDNVEMVRRINAEMWSGCTLDVDDLHSLVCALCADPEVLETLNTWVAERNADLAQCKLEESALADVLLAL